MIKQKLSIKMGTMTPVPSSSNDAYEVTQWERFCKMILDKLLYIHRDPLALPAAELQQHYTATQWTVAQLTQVGAD